MEEQSKQTETAKRFNFALLGLLVVAALSIAGLAVYSLTNTGKRLTPISQVESSSSVSSVASDAYSFSDGLLKLTYALPEQESYGERNVFLLGQECYEQGPSCVSLDFVDQQESEWVVAQTSFYFPKFDQNAPALRFNLLPYRVNLTAKAGCDGLCGVSATIFLSRLENNLSLDDAVEEMGDLQLPITIEEKLTMWGTLVYRLNVPESLETAQTREVYIARHLENLYFVDVYFNSEEFRPQVTEVLNSFKFIN